MNRINKRFESHVRQTVVAAVVTALASASNSSAALTNPLSCGSLGSLDVGVGNAVTIDTTLGEIRINGNLAYTGVLDNQAGQADVRAGIPELAVFSFDDINIGVANAITITGTRGLALLSRGDVTIRSRISVDGGDLGQASPAGGYAGNANGGHGAGPGGGRASTIGIYFGGGGGAFGGNGGNGTGYLPTDAMGGGAYPAANSITTTLFGGSGGASGLNGDSPGAGGGGGGALEISALGDIKLYSSVTSNGGAAGVGMFGYGGGGGGSGGAIRLAGQTVTLGPSASVSAAGNAGGAATSGGGFTAGGGGGGGRILIQQRANPLVAGISVAGGSAIGGALPGASGTIEQYAVSIGVSPASLNVRLGTGPVTAIASLSRIGDADTSVYGFVNHVGTGFSGASVGSTFAFSGPIGGAVAYTFPLTFATNSRTTQSVTIKSSGGDATVAIGRGVGPIFATNMGTSPTSTINLGGTELGYTASFHLIIHNASSDLGISSPLTSLQVLSIVLSGPDASSFSVDNLTPLLLMEQQYANLPIYFVPTESRVYQATLTIRTDQGAANGAAGEVFTYQLRGAGRVSTPEPAAASLLLICTVVGRRRCSKSCGDRA